MSIFDENRDAGQAIAEESPEAAGLLVGILQANADAQARLQEDIVGWKEAEIERWKTRALDAEERLARIETRIWELLT